MEEAPVKPEPIDNNNMEEAPLPTLSLDSCIPVPQAFEGPHHPFKTALECKRELEVNKLKQQLLQKHMQHAAVAPPEESREKRDTHCRRRHKGVPTPDVSESDSATRTSERHPLVNGLLSSHGLCAPDERGTGGAACLALCAENDDLQVLGRRSQSDGKTQFLVRWNKHLSM